MAQKQIAYFTAKKVISPVGKIFNYPSGKDFGIVTNAGFVYTAVGTDTLILTGDGWQLIVAEDFADINTALSATNISGS